MAVYTVFILSAFLVSSSVAKKHDIYSGYTVHGVKLTEQSHLELLHTLEVSLDADVWQHGAVHQRDALVMVSPKNKEAFLEVLNNNGVEHYLHLEDVYKAFEEHDDEISRFEQSRTSQRVFERFSRYAEINEYLEKIAAEYPDIVTLIDAGTSWENRAIKYLKISTTNFTDTSKPIYYMDAMIHACEWVTSPVALYSIHRLIEDLRDEDRDLLENLDWIIHPLVNPDGNEYSHTTERLWRRTRSYYPEINDTCYGVDANRNFDVSFNTVGVSSDPCSNFYPGHLPFSEPETRIVRDILEEHFDRTQLYLSIHSYGNLMLYGYGNSSLPSNVDQIQHVTATMGAVMDAAKLPEADFYVVGNSALTLYPTSGTAMDYGQNMGVPFSFTVELPSYGQDFRVPPRYINHINAETWRGIAATARLARSYYDARNAN